MLNSHLTLIENLKDGERTFSSLSKSEFKCVYEASIASGDLTALRILTNHHTGIYDYDDRAPKWLNSKFEEPQWVLMLNKTPRIIRWDSVYLDDGEKLTNPKHTRLLNTFKYWITATDNPLENGGNKELSINVISEKLGHVIALINSILLHSAKLKLAEHHLLNIDDNFWLNILTDIAISGRNGIFDFYSRTKILLDDAIKHISDAEVEHFISDYPLLTKTLAPDDIDLHLHNRQKACVWLFKLGYYNKSPQGNNQLLIKLHFDGKCLWDSNVVTKTLPELHLKPQPIKTEFKAFESINPSNFVTADYLNRVISSLKLIHTNLERNDTCTPNIIGKCITVKAINEIKDVKLKAKGRTRNLPASFVFQLIEQCYAFTEENQESLLEQCLNILKESKKKSIKQHSNKHRPNKRRPQYNRALHEHLPVTERGHWLQYEAVNCVSSEWLKKGIKQVDNFTTETETRHQRIRNNESLFDLFNVLQGAIQFLTGAIMARRQDELVKLKAYGNLSPNIDLFLAEDEGALLKEGSSEKSCKTQYSLKFKLKKSGRTGENETIERPIPTSIAKFIWRLEQFNRKAEEAKLTKGKLSLFSSLHLHQYKLRPVIAGTFDKHFDAMCDYFETDLVLMDNGEYRRNYVRQHQLRRFFAMTFFWSKRFQGIDALRWMLGHTDMQHLYHYISESETGEAMNGVKASVLTSSIIDKNSNHADIENLDKLRKLLAKKLTGDETKDIELMSPSEAVSYYDDVDYKTVPHINQIKKEQELETKILSLLNDQIITLEPHFFTVELEDGEQIKTFNLVLEINEID